ncbi:uncharacterized protein SOCEGT47_045780 [Sorangium cellulosum]|uniref:Phage resistance protein n=1 Tax=Sorangium cellulosum TaxID=56 RepID=A0A4P2Q3X8_SORCE|nr:hypothetical protein [Sorangium cellulosum]AUX24045.1 uncharacterized protein SOCEGT47_045780 [Sorangium cellulosum]
MSDPIRVRDLFDLPEQIRKGDFVHRLSEGVLAPVETARTYVVTPAIAGAFDRALKLVGSALREGRSQASYIHGSFGSGKSHFMALLSLLLDGHEAAWRIPELHPLRAAHAWGGDRKLLQLRFHMVGQPSLEVAIFEEYVRHVREHHATAPDWCGSRSSAPLPTGPSRPLWIRSRCFAGSRPASRPRASTP